MAITIIGIPFAAQAVKLAGYALWPFGRTLIPGPKSRRKGLSTFANILWFVLAGWWLALAQAHRGLPALHHDHRHPARGGLVQDGRRGRSFRSASRS